MLKNKSILITGGTGSFGKFFLKILLKKFKKIKKIIIYSRDELKQSEMKITYPEKKYPNIRFFLGDVRDYKRLIMAMEDVNIVIHAAALKQVPAAEYDPFEFIKTNVLGAQNIIEACLEKNVEKVIALSTDKAASPINLYGATKLCSDKLFSAANNVVGNKKTRFSIVRYGNVMGSRGSVIPFFKKIVKEKKSYFPITNKYMTRFNITLEESVDLVLWSIKNAKGGEIIVPKVPSFNILDLANAIDKNKTKKIIGIRPGEKIFEELITEHDLENTVDIGKYYVIYNPSIHKVAKFYKKYKKINLKTSYNSQDNNSFLTVKKLQKILKKIN